MTDIKQLTTQLEDSWIGAPWFGRPALQLLADVTEAEAYYRPAGQHSIAELVWHMVNWRAFVLSRIEAGPRPDIDLFEKNDWRAVSPDGPNNWADGWQQLQQLQENLLAGVAQLDAMNLDQNVAGRTYSVRSMLHGIVQHDIYHLGQIAYIRKMWRAQKEESNGLERCREGRQDNGDE